MTYKILLIKNRYDKLLNFQPCLDWFQTNMGITMTIEERVTDFDFTTQNIGNATWKGVIAGNLPELFATEPTDAYNAIVVVYGNGLDGIRLSCCNGVNGLQNHSPNTEIIQLANSRWQTLNHELFHAFFAKANRFGAKLYDPMDTYYRDSELALDQGQTTRTVAVKNLIPFLPTICQFMQSTPTVTITRSYNPKETPGILEAQNAGAIFTCKSLELVWLDNKSVISCIPAGTYQCSWTFSPKFMRYTYQVLNVPKRSGIRFHWGNYGYGKTVSIQGCILLGASFLDINGDTVPDILSTKKTIQLFEKFLEKKPFTLVIQ